MEKTRKTPVKFGSSKIPRKIWAHKFAVPTINFIKIGEKYIIEIGQHVVPIIRLLTFLAVLSNMSIDYRENGLNFLILGQIRYLKNNDALPSSLTIYDRVRL